MVNESRGKEAGKVSISEAYVSLYFCGGHKGLKGKG